MKKLIAILLVLAVSAGAQIAPMTPPPSPTTGTGNWVRATSPTFSGTVQVGSGGATSAGWIFGYAGFSGFSSIWPTSVTPNSGNYVLNAGSTETTINASDQVTITINGIITATITNPSGASPRWRMSAVLFANLGAPTNGTQSYCSNCAQTTPYVDTTCTSGGTGAMAYRLNGAWKCFN